MARILIVDDEAKLSNMLSSYLLKNGYEISEASNGVEALIELNELPPDLIVLDVEMPGIDGYEVCKRIRKIDKHKYLPILMTSRIITPEDISKGNQAGANDYITKPYNLKNIAKKIENLLKND